MTPSPLSPSGGDTPRLLDLCDELELRQVPADLVEELRALSQRFWTTWPASMPSGNGLRTMRGGRSNLVISLDEARRRLQELLREIVSRP